MAGSHGVGEGGRYVKRDYYAGGLVSLVGAFVALNALNYQIGSLTRMGPGMFPLVLGILLAALGVLIAVNAGEVEGDSLDHLADDASPYPDVRGGVAIVGGMIAFIFLTQTIGFVGGTFACVFLAAIGDRKSTWIGSVVLSVVVTVIGVLVFIYGLKMNLPLFQLQGFSL
jgi:Tripartite tricarboxylate transporter TctB family